MHQTKLNGDSQRQIATLSTQKKPNLNTTRRITNAWPALFKRSLRILAVMFVCMIPIKRRLTMNWNHIFVCISNILYGFRWVEFFPRLFLDWPRHQHINYNSDSIKCHCIPSGCDRSFYLILIDLYGWNWQFSLIIIMPFPKNRLPNVFNICSPLSNFEENTRISALCGMCEW